LGPEDRLLACVPLSHVTGLVALVATAVRVTGTLIVMPTFRATEFLDIAARERMTHTLMVPAMYKLCLLEPDFASHALSSWRVGGYGGAPMPAATIAELRGVLPRDIDPGVRELPGVRLVDIEDLRQAVAAGADHDTGRSSALPLVREIVDEEVNDFRAIRRANEVAPTVVALRAQARDVVESELSRLHGRLPDDLDERTREEIGRAMRRVADKLLHRPTVRVKELAAAPDGEAYEAALRQLFDLDLQTQQTPKAPEPVAEPVRPTTAARTAQEKA
jgi:hypothetical protein